MNCMKCGYEIPEGQVFCDNCLEEMDRYPVNQNTPVVLPQRTVSPVLSKTPRKKTASLETQVVTLKHRIRVLTVLLITVSVLVSLLIYPAVKYLMEDRFLPGQNYKSIESKTSETEATLSE